MNSKSPTNDEAIRNTPALFYIDIILRYFSTIETVNLLLLNIEDAAILFNRSATDCTVQQSVSGIPIPICRNIHTKEWVAIQVLLNEQYGALCRQCSILADLHGTHSTAARATSP